MILIEVTQANGKAVFINPETITHIRPVTDERCAVYFVSGEAITLAASADHAADMLIGEIEDDDDE